MYPVEIQVGFRIVSDGVSAAVSGNRIRRIHVEVSQREGKAKAIVAATGIVTTVAADAKIPHIGGFTAVGAKIVNAVFQFLMVKADTACEIKVTGTLKDNAFVDAGRFGNAAGGCRVRRLPLRSPCC